MLKLKHIFLLITVSLLILSMSRSASSVTLVLTVVPDKTVHNVSDKLFVAGNLTKDGSVVTDALVSVEIDDPHGVPFAVRTLQTGAINSSLLPAQIVGFTPCDSVGNPKYNFTPGGNIYFSITVRSNAGNDLSAIVVLTLLDSNAFPFLVEIEFNGTLNPGFPITVITSAISIPTTVVRGNATACANLFGALPRDNGLAYGPESSASFMISTNSTPQQSLTVNNGQFNMTVPLLTRPTSSLLLQLGNYTVYGTTYYSYVLRTTSSTFRLVLIGDLYLDGTINMRDISILARAFNTIPGDPLWNPIADLDNSGKVDMRDIAIVAKNFGAQVRL